MRPALWSVAIQAAGSAATLGAALLVSSQLGLAAQGEFGLLRSWTDALGTLAVIGLPQGLLHMQYREGVSVSALRAWVMRYINMLLAVLIALLLLHAFVLPSAWTPALLQGPQMLWALLLTVVMGASHLLWRSLALRDVGLVPYAALTASPSLVVLAALVVVCAIGQRSGLVWALFAGALISSLASAWMVARVARNEAADVRKADWSRRSLWAVSSQTGVQNILTALSPPLVLSTAAALGASLAQIGVVSLGLHVYQVFGVAATYMAPMVYDKAARAEQPMSQQHLLTWLRERLTLRAVLVFGMAVALAMWLLRSLWPTGADSLVLVGAMASAGALAMAVRLIVTLMQAHGAYRALSWHALGRLLLSVGGTAALMTVWPAVLAVPIALLVAELILLVWVWKLMQAKTEAKAQEPA
jgi:hypothetical protein